MNQDPRTLLAALLNASNFPGQVHGMHRTVTESPSEVHALCEKRIESTLKYIAEQRHRQNNIYPKASSNQSLKGMKREHSSPPDVPCPKHDKETKVVPESAVVGGTHPTALLPQCTNHTVAVTHPNENVDGMGMERTSTQVRMKIVCERCEVTVLTLPENAPLQLLLTVIQEKEPRTKERAFSLIESASRHVVLRYPPPPIEATNAPAEAYDLQVLKAALPPGVRASCVLTITWLDAEPSDVGRPKDGTCPTPSLGGVTSVLWNTVSSLTAQLNPFGRDVPQHTANITSSGSPSTRASTSSSSPQTSRVGPRIVTLRTVQGKHTKRTSEDGSTHEEDSSEEEEGTHGSRETYDNGTNQAFFKK